MGILDALESLGSFTKDQLSKVGDMAKEATQRNADIIQRIAAGQPAQLGDIASTLSGVMPIGGMAKVFKPAPSGIRNLAEMAGKSDIPETALEKMFPALIDTSSGEVVHGMRAVGPGGHATLYDAVASLKGFAPTRGFVDPATFKAYTESQLENILQKQHYGR